jgi:hypothetical protein
VAGRELLPGKASSELACKRLCGVGAGLVMSASDQPVEHPRACEPLRPAWRMQCQCWFRAGRPGEIAACGCGYWWRVSRRGHWYAISERRAFRALLPGLMRELAGFELAGGWPAD